MGQIMINVHLGMKYELERRSRLGKLLKERAIPMEGRLSIEANIYIAATE